MISYYGLTKHRKNNKGAANFYNNRQHNVLQ